MKKGLLVAAALLMAAAPVTAQNMSAMLADDFERQRRNVLGMVDAMPESGIRSAPTEGVRDFAQQIEHVVQGNLGIIGSGFDRPTPVEGHNPDTYLNSKDALKAFVNAGYDAVNEMVSGLSNAEMMEETSLFGAATVTRYKLIVTAHEHAVWTLGATIPYVRLNGGTPPAYGLVPGGM